MYINDVALCLSAGTGDATIWCRKQDKITDTFIVYRSDTMASKKGNRIVIKLKSTESGHQYTSQKNRKNDPSRLELRRYDPIVRRHVLYRETK
jgi:large subunit ribosomal protein L33